MHLTETERRVLQVLQNGMPTTLTPYQDMARQAGITTDGLLDLLRKWRQDGIVRRVGAVVNHFRLGLDAGAMVVWNIPPQRLHETGQLFAGFEQVSHAYERATTEHWPYDLYTMVHGRTDEEVRRTVEAMATVAGASDYQMLRTERELKKAPPTYVTQ